MCIPWVLELLTQFSMLEHPLSSFFLYTKIFYLYHLLNIIHTNRLSFLVLWSIHLSSPMANFKNSPEYFERVFFPASLPLMMFCFRVGFREVSLFSATFSQYFFHLWLFDGVHFEYSQLLVIFFFFFQIFRCFFVLSVELLLLFLVSAFLLLAWHII